MTSESLHSYTYIKAYGQNIMYHQEIFVKWKHLRPHPLSSNKF